jgi:hypothetical protein
MSGKVKQKNDIETTAITNDDNKMNESIMSSSTVAADSDVEQFLKGVNGEQTEFEERQQLTAKLAKQGTLIKRNSQSIKKIEKLATDAMNLAKREKKKGVVTRSVVSKMARHVNLPESSDVKKLKKMVVKESSTSTSTSSSSSSKHAAAYTNHVNRAQKKRREEEEKNKAKTKFAGSSFVNASLKKPGCNF